MQTLLLAMFGLALMPAHAADRSDVIDGTEGGEAVAFRGTVDRFSDRMVEFNQEARQFIQDTRAAEFRALEQGYAGSIEDLENQEKAIRGEAITRLKDFLARYPRSEHTPHAMFLLGDLYYQGAIDQHRLDVAAYEQGQRGVPCASDGDCLSPARCLEDEAGLFCIDVNAAEEEPKEDFSSSLALFQGIVNDFPEYENVDGSWYMIGWIHNRGGSLQYDTVKARDGYLALVKDKPDSIFAAAANVAIADYYFAESKYPDAIIHFNRVVELHEPDGKHYAAGVFGLAWSYHAGLEYDKSQAMFAKFLDFSEDTRARSGAPSELHETAEDYLAQSFIWQSDKYAIGGVEEGLGALAPVVAQRFFQKLGDRDYESSVMLRLAKGLEESGDTRYSEAIAVYDHIMSRWPNDPDNPLHLRRMATLYMSLSPPQEATARATFNRMFEMFNRDSPWAHANRDNPDALAVADDFIENTLGDKAKESHEAARLELQAAKAINPETRFTPKSIELYTEAARLYEQYLMRFDLAADYYEIQWYMASALANSRQMVEAEAEYTKLMKSKGHDYSEGASFKRYLLRRQILTDRYGNLEERNPTAAVESQITMQDGTPRPVYVIGDDYLRFIEDAGALVEATFEDPRPEDKFAPLLEAARPSMVYEPGQIYFSHGHYDKARELLHQVIERWPLTENAQFAARNIMVSYQEEGDLANVRLWGGKFSRMQLGEDPTANAEFADLEEGAAFKMAAALRKSGDNENAAQAYLDFMRDFPDSQYIQAAHKNAAYAHKDIEQLHKANELFLDYIARIEKGEYKPEPSDWAIYDMIAEGYALTLELDQAVRFYELLYQRSQASDEPYELEDNALYNAGSLKIGLGDHRGAAEALEKYALAVRAKSATDAEETMFLAGEQWERVGQQDGLDFYRRYLDTFGDTNPNNVMKAHYRIAKLNEAIGRDVEPSWTALLTTYQRLKPGGGVDGAGRKYAAMAALRPLQRSYATFAKYEYPDTWPAMGALIAAKKQEYGLFVKQCEDLIVEYKEFESTSAAFYLMGMAGYTMGAFVYDIPQTDDLPDATYEYFQEESFALIDNAEGKGRAKLELLLEKAKTEGWNEWTAKTLEYLSQKDPMTFAPDRPEVRNLSGSMVFPRAQPMSTVTVAPEAQPSVAPPPAQPGAGVPVPQPTPQPTPPADPAPDSGDGGGVW